MSRQQTNVAKGIQAGSNRPGINNLALALSSTLLSSQRTTTHRRSGPPSRRSGPRGTRSTLLGLRGVVNRYFPVGTTLPQSSREPGAQQCCDPKFEGFGRTAAADLSARSPVSLPARKTLQARSPGSKSGTSVTHLRRSALENGKDRPLPAGHLRLLSAAADESRSGGAWGSPDRVHRGPGGKTRNETTEGSGNHG
jgi:hypothetical protein